jgi:hypothetical protein
LTDAAGDRGYHVAHIVYAKLILESVFDWKRY